MRLFVSIDFPEKIIQEIQSWIPDKKGWKKTSIHQMHLTLVFLGECSKKEKDEIHKLLSQIEFQPFELEIHGLGAFPNESSPRILWAGIELNKDLKKLQQKITRSLCKFVKSKKSNSYVPHITIARKKSRNGFSSIPTINFQKETGVLIVPVNSFQLKKSILHSSGSEHQILNQYS